MRNLKRALSLTLASVMLLGMMVVGAGAAGYPDVDDEDNVEAIEVLQAVEVMRGDDKGNFNPDSPVTRSEMAVVMALLLNLDYEYYETTCPFWDVPTWARGYVGACYANGIVSGYGDGTYGAADGVTAVQAASMMMRALGYFKYSEDYKDGFELVTVRQGTEIGIFDGVGSSATAQMTRNQVAKMALNALQSEMVTFTGTPGTTYTASSGETLSIGYRAEYTPRTSTEAKYQAIEQRTSDVQNDSNVNRGQYYIQLGEELYNGKLRLDSVTDPFKRPARRWEFNGKEVGTYVKEELIRKVWTEKVTGKMLTDLLTKPTIDKYEFTIAVDGVDTSTTNAATLLGKAYFDKTYLNSSYGDKVGETGNGVTTEVYVDTGIQHIYIAVINTYLAKAISNYDDVRKEASFKVYAVDEKNNSTTNPVLVKDRNRTTDQSETLTVSADDFAVENVKKDDIVLVNVAEGEIQIMRDPEVMSGVSLTAFSTNDYVITDGNKINLNVAAQYDAEVLDQFTDAAGVTNLRDLHYNLYLDQNGFILGMELVENYDNYVFLTGINADNNDLTRQTADAAGILTDGTFVNFKINLDKSRRINPAANTYNTSSANVSFKGGSMWNTWCTYSVDSNDVWTLYQVGSVNGTKKAGQVHTVGNYYTGNTKNEINDKNYTMSGNGTDFAATANSVGHMWTVSNGNNIDAPLARIYGNEDSIYMAADMKAVLTKGAMDVGNGSGDNDKAGDSVRAITGKQMAVAQNKYAAIISGVETRTVGIKKTDMTIWNTENAILNDVEGYSINGVEGSGDTRLIPSGVYALYKNNGAIIAAVVIGEDNGVDTHWIVAKNDKVKEERWEASTAKAATEGTWVWTREVYDLTEGKETTIEERGDHPDQISEEKMPWKTGGLVNVYEVRTDADGLVTKTKNALTVLGQFIDDQAQGGSTTTNQNGYVTKIEDVELALQDSKKSSIIFRSATDFTDGWRLNGQMLYTSTTTSKGFLVDPNVTTFFIQTTNGENKTIVRNGSDELKSFLEKLNTNATYTNGRYQLTALIQGAAAKAIILEDLVPHGNNKGDITGNVTLTLSGDLKDARVFLTDGTEFKGTPYFTTSTRFTVPANTDLRIYDDSIVSGTKLTDFTCDTTADKNNNNDTTMSVAGAAYGYVTVTLKASDTISKGTSSGGNENTSVLSAKWENWGKGTLTMPWIVNTVKASGEATREDIEAYVRNEMAEKGYVYVGQVILTVDPSVINSAKPVAEGDEAAAKVNVPALKFTHVTTGADRYIVIDVDELGETVTPDEPTQVTVVNKGDSLDEAMADENTEEILLNTDATTEDAPTKPVEVSDNSTLTLDGTTSMEISSEAPITGNGITEIDTSVTGAENIQTKSAVVRDGVDLDTLPASENVTVEGESTIDTLSVGEDQTLTLTKDTVITTEELGNIEGEIIAEEGAKIVLTEDSTTVPEIKNVKFYDVAGNEIKAPTESAMLFARATTVDPASIMPVGDYTYTTVDGKTGWFLNVGETYNAPQSRDREEVEADVVKASKQKVKVTGNSTDGFTVVITQDAIVRAKTADVKSALTENELKANKYGSDTIHTWYNTSNGYAKGEGKDMIGLIIMTLDCPEGAGSVKMTGTNTKGESAWLKYATPAGKNPSDPPQPSLQIPLHVNEGMSETRTFQFWSGGNNAKGKGYVVAEYEVTFEYSGLTHREMTTEGQES